MPQNHQVGARLLISGALQFKDADGNVLKTVEMTGGVSLSELGLSVEDAQALIASQEKTHGTDHRQ